MVRLDFRYRDRPERAWLLIENGDAELYAFDPGPNQDAIVTIHDPLTFARWHLGHISWATALRSGGVSISGLCELVRSLPTWTRRPEIGRQLEREDKRTDFYGKRSSVLIIDPHQHHPALGIAASWLFLAPAPHAFHLSGTDRAGVALRGRCRARYVGGGDQLMPRVAASMRFHYQCDAHKPVAYRTARADLLEWCRRV